MVCGLQAEIGRRDEEDTLAGWIVLQVHRALNKAICLGIMVGMARRLNARSWEGHGKEQEMILKFTLAFLEDACFCE